MQTLEQVSANPKPGSSRSPIPAVCDWCFLSGGRGLPPWARPVRREPVVALRRKGQKLRELFNMAEDTASAAQSPRGRADGEDAGSPGERVADTVTDDQEQFECQELLDCQVQPGVPEEEEEEGGLMAEAEAVAAGWMLDFLCVSLCRAFRDGRSDDFHRTRDSAEGECWARPGRERDPRWATEAWFAALYLRGRGSGCLLRAPGSKSIVGSNPASASHGLLSFSQSHNFTSW